ncbi:hypothetical protein Tco_0347771 [Tanacetum coccineum]
MATTMIGPPMAVSVIVAWCSGGSIRWCSGGFDKCSERMELEAEIFGAGAQLMGLQFIQLELRLGKNPSRSFRPVKSAEILWQFWASSSFGASLAHDGS